MVSHNGSFNAIGEEIQVMEETPVGNGRRGFRARVTGGMLVMFLAFLVISLLDAHIIKPVLGFWEPIFVFLFGDINGKWGGTVPKFLGFLLFSCGATVASAITVDAVVNSRYFVISARPLYKVSFVKQTMSFFRNSANAYRNLKQARSVLLRVGGIEIPAFVTKERTFWSMAGKFHTLFCIVRTPRHFLLAILSTFPKREWRPVQSLTCRGKNWLKMC